MSPARSRPTRTFWLVLGLIVLVAAGIRVGYTLGWKQDAEPCSLLPPPQLCGDSFVYHEGANLLAQGEGLIAPPRFLYGEGDHFQSADHPPLFIVYLAGFSLVGLDSVLAHQLASILMGLAGVVLIALLGREVAGEVAGLTAGALAAVYAYLLVNEPLVMSETAAITFTAATVWQAYRFRRSPSLRGALAFGALGGLAALTRAELILYLPLVGCFLAWGVGRRWWADRLKPLAVMALASLAVLSPWVVRNLLTFERPVLLSTGLGITLAYTNCDRVYHGELLGYWYLPCGQPIPQEADQSLDEVVFRERALEYVRDNADRLPVVVAARVARQWGLYRPGQMTALETFEGRDRPVSQIGLGQYYAMLPFAAVGVVALRRRRVPVWPLLSLGVIVTFGAALTYGNTRFRTPFEVALVVLAAAGIVAVGDWLARLGRRPTAVGSTA